MSNAPTADLVRSHLQQMIASGKRSDGRGPWDYRPIKIHKGYVSSAEGSARVTLGATDVLVGVKMALGEPYPDSPNAGTLSTAAELVPMASPTFEMGPPSPNAIELARVVDRGIRETKTIDFKKLCIVPGEKVWTVFLDIHVLDYDGNLFDACSYGSLAALSVANFPANEKLGTPASPLPVEHHPISITVAKIGKTIIADPALEEEEIADARLTVAIDENDDIRAMQKGLNGSFTYDDVVEVIQAAQRKSKEIRPRIVG